MTTLSPGPEGRPPLVAARRYAAQLRARVRTTERPTDRWRPVVNLTVLAAVNPKVERSVRQAQENASRPAGDDFDHGPAVRIRGVTHRYGDHLAVDALSVEMARGETLALLGPNGAGKSTTISLVLGLLRPHEGAVEVFGTTPRRALAEGRVGAMLQTGLGSGLPPGVSVEQSLRLVRRLYRRPASFEATVERAGISSLLRRQTQRLSGGQAQRVRFALAIAGDPELVILDEPTSAMDVEARRSFWRMLRQFGDEGRTVVFATHHLQEADETADRVLVIHHGRLVADGPGATLKAAVAARRVRFVTDGPPPCALEGLEGVTDVERHGQTVTLHSLDADATVRALVASGIAFRDLEVAGAGLEEAFVALTEGPSRVEAGAA